MSYAVVLALSNCAIAATDTRSTRTYNANDVEVYDLEPRTIYAPQGDIIVSAEDLKLRRYAGGWATGTGNTSVVYTCLDALSKSNARTPITINKVLQDAFDTNIDNIRLNYTRTDRLHGMIMCIYTTASQFKAHGYSVGKEQATIAADKILASYPSDLSDQNQITASNYFSLIDTQRDGKEFHNVIRCFAHSFHYVSTLAPSVNDYLNLVVMLRLPDGGILTQRLFAKNTDVLAWNNEQLTAAFKTI
jgi:hypothetical protein